MHVPAPFRPLAVAAVAVTVAGGLLLLLARPTAVRLDGALLALLERAQNAAVTAPVLWVDTQSDGGDLAKLRGGIASAIDAAARGHARAIVVAVPLDTPSDNADLARVRSFLEATDPAPDATMRARLAAWIAELDHDAQLERAIRAAGNVVLLATPLAAPLERFAGGARRVGVEPATAAAADGVYRRDAYFGVDGSGASAPSLPLAGWLAARGIAGDARLEGGKLRAGSDALRAGADGDWIPAYGRRAAEAGGTPRVTLEELTAGKVTPAQLNNARVVIGHGGQLLEVATGGELSVGEALTQRLASLESDDFMIPLRFGRAFAVLLLLVAIVWAAVFAPQLAPLPRTVVTLLVTFGLMLLEVALLAAAHLWLPLLLPALAVPLAVLAASLTPERVSAAARAAPTALPPTRPLSPAFARPKAVAMSAAVGGEPDEAEADEDPDATREYPPRGAPAPPPPPPPTPATAPPPSIRQISEALEARRHEASRSDVADLLLGRSRKPAKPKLGRYELDRELGHGAMGTVYLGRDPRINRVVAIKAIPITEEFTEPDLAEARARFFREAEMAGRLRHPGIVTVYDAGEDGGIAWIAMEYVHGALLSQHAVSDRLLPPAQVLELIARVADALEYAHAQDVVHRDIKPANVLFDPKTLETKITDFGIARLASSSTTRTGVILGTPSFMAPEQLEGRNVTGRSDLFALGVTLFQLLAGQLPFRADSMTGLMDKIANAAHPPLRSIRPDLPPCVSSIIDRALQKDPEKRYASAAEMARALRACGWSLSA